MEQTGSQPTPLADGQEQRTLWRCPHWAFERLPRVPEVFKALRVREEAEVAGVREGEVTENGTINLWADSDTGRTHSTHSPHCLP